MVLSIQHSNTAPKARAFRLGVLAAVVFAVCYVDVEIVDDQEVIAADQGDEDKAADVKVDPNIPEDSFPGKEDGFERGTDPDGNDVYKYEYQNQVYIIPADSYYQWRSEYYHDDYHGGLTSVMLHALLISHLYRATAFSPSYYRTSYHFGPPVGAYYASAAYTSHFGPPTMQGGRVVHGGSPTTTRTGTLDAAARALGSGGARCWKQFQTITIRSRPVVDP